MQGENVVKCLESLLPGFPSTNGRIIEFFHECCQGIGETGGKEPGFAQTYLKGLDEAV
jgi:hypothetical protein